MAMSDRHVWSVNSSSLSRFLSSNLPTNNVQFSLPRLLPWQLSEKPGEASVGDRLDYLPRGSTSDIHQCALHASAHSLLPHLFRTASHQDVLNCRRHGNDAVRVTWLEKLRSWQKVTGRRKEINFPRCLRQVEHVLTLKAQCVQRTVPGVHLQTCASRLIRRAAPCANRRLLVQHSHDEAERRAARPHFTGR